ncbi:hypothetical protein BRADI_2g57850v3 [Brachypodium distachyon]|uniref:GRF-type domain-containing protein n=1 Tax=Brachypodium distachyon TaxID=15368 RepID=I1HUA8_BRADI|nr:hypothetical protein BRADI_2g57850v3 [Brachypodium distachyon]
MPSWPDGCSGNSYSFLDHCGHSDSSDSDGSGRRVEEGWPDRIRDPDYNGKETTMEMKCWCELPVCRYVAFEGMNLGRKFLGCPLEHEKRCAFVRWVDHVWCPRLKRSIQQLWWMLQEKDLEKENAIWDGKDEISALKCSMDEEKMKMQMDEAALLIALEARNAILMQRMRAQVYKYKMWCSVAFGVAGCFVAAFVGFMLKHP